jgi:hypothetical protein
MSSFLAIFPSKAAFRSWFAQHSRMIASDPRSVNLNPSKSMINNEIRFHFQELLRKVDKGPASAWAQQQHPKRFALSLPYGRDRFRIPHFTSTIQPTRGGRSPAGPL